MKFLLLSPHHVHPEANAGWQFITAGVETLLSQADNAATFENFNGFTPDAWPDAEFFKAFDYIVICGNPRWGFSAVDSWLYIGMLLRLRDLQKVCGFAVLDAWQGAGYPLSMMDAVAQLTRHDANIQTAELLKALGAKIITRDKTASAVCDAFALPHVRLPCSSFFGVDKFATMTKAERTRKIIVANNLDGYAGGAGILRSLSRHYEVIATCLGDSVFCSRERIRHSLIYSPFDLTALYSECVAVVSFRLHAAIPAAACGAAVFNLALDSRSETCDAFALPYGDYRDGVSSVGFAQNMVAPVSELMDLLGVR